MKQLPFEYRVVSSLEGHHVVLIRDGTPTMWQLIATFQNKDRAGDYADLEEQMARDFLDDPEGPWRYDAIAADPIVPPEPPSALKRGNFVATRDRPLLPANTNMDDLLTEAEVKALLKGVWDDIDKKYSPLPTPFEPLPPASDATPPPSGRLPTDLGRGGDPMPGAKIDYLLAERAAAEAIEAAEPTTCLDPQPPAEESEVVPHSAVPCVGDNAGAGGTERARRPDAPAPKVDNAAAKIDKPDAPEPLQASADADEEPPAPHEEIAAPLPRTEDSMPPRFMGGRGNVLPPGEAERRATVVLQAIKKMTAEKVKITAETLVSRTGIHTISVVLAGLKANGLIRMIKGHQQSEDVKRYGGIRLAERPPASVRYQQPAPVAKKAPGPSAPPLAPKPKPTIQTFAPRKPAREPPVLAPDRDAEEARLIAEHVKKNGVTKIGPLSVENPNVDEVMAAVRVDGAEVVPAGQGFMRFSVNGQPPIDRETLLARANRTRIWKGMPVWSYDRVQWKRPDPEPVLYNGTGNAAQKAAAKAKAAKASATP